MGISESDWLPVRTVIKGKAPNFFLSCSISVPGHTSNLNPVNLASFNLLKTHDLFMLHNIFILGCIPILYNTSLLYKRYA